jgi:LuxR family maltose regulon positive regulatory protein
MSGPLCDAVLDTTGSAAWLTEIQALNLFIVPIDEQGEWYRYHRLFAEMLLSELRRREPGEEYRIRRRAARWFEEHGLPEQAITHALAGQDTATAARLISRYTQQFNNEGRITLVRSWLLAFDDDDLQRYPALAVMAAWVWALTGDAERAHRSLRIAESGTFDGMLPDGSASLGSAVARARAALAPYGIDRMLADTTRAVRLEPLGSLWHPMAAALHATACLLTGSPDEAAKGFERAARLGRGGHRPSASFALAQQSLLAADRGDWSTAGACATESRQLMEEAHLLTYPTNLLTYAACARVAVQRADTQAAWNDVLIALRHYQRPTPVAFPWLAAQVAIVLGRILLDLGDEQAARLKATEAGRHLASLLTEGVLREQYRQLVADLDRARSRSRAQDAANLTKAELRILRLLPTHHSLTEIAQDRLISRNTVKSQVASIYLKLNVTSRAGAVEKARTTGLLDR